MNLEEYQGIVDETAIYPREFAYGYVALGINGEFQEFCEAGGEKENLKEFGDVCWYITAACRDWGLQLPNVFPEDYKSLPKNSLFPQKEEDFIQEVNKAIGVLSELTKKFYRDGTKPHSTQITIVLFNLCFNLCGIAECRDIDISEALQANYDKLLKRKELNMIGGSGSDREETV